MAYQFSKVDAILKAILHLRKSCFENPVMFLGSQSLGDGKKELEFKSTDNPSYHLESMLC